MMMSMIKMTSTHIMWRPQEWMITMRTMTATVTMTPHKTISAVRQTVMQMTVTAKIKTSIMMTYQKKQPQNQQM